jgi:beta-lactamase regulating signal transducer with metallopeptidase domain
MPSLSQSPILQALGYAIAHSLWQMALVWIVYVLLNSLFKFKSEIRYRIAVAAQVIGFAWFLSTLQFYYQQCSHALAVAEAIYLETGDQSAVVYGNKMSLLSFFIKAEQLLPYLSVAYLLLLAFLIIRWFRAYRYTQIVRLNGLHKIDVDWKLFVNKVAGQLGIKQKVRIYLSELVQSPVTMGFLKPVILIPIASFNHLTPQQLEAVILHELAHIKRHDYLLNIVLSIIELGLFFNPFTRLINKSVSKERENSCDDWVLQYQYSPAMYAEALLRIAVMQKSPAMAMYAVKTKSELAGRVQRMINQKDGRFSYRHQLIALLLMTGILASIAWYDPNSMKNPDLKPTADNKAVVMEPLAAKVDNPLFNPMFFLNEPLKEEVKKNVEATQKQMRKRTKEQLALQEIHLPTLMAPMAIQNLKELERNLAAVKQDLRKNIRSSAAATRAALAQSHWYNAAQGNDHAFMHFDSLRFFNGNTAVVQEINWKAINEEMKVSQKAIADALKQGAISQLDAKKMQLEIADAFAKLKDLKMPQVYGFAPGTNQFFRPEDEKDFYGDQKIKEKTTEKSRTANKEKTNEARAKRILMDSLRTNLPNATPLKAGQVYGYVVTEGRPSAIIVDKEHQVYAQGLPKPPANRPTPAPASPKLRGTAAADVVTTYVYTDEDAGEDCEKANRFERSRRVITTTATAQGQSTRKKAAKSSCTTTKPATTITKKGNSVQVTVAPANQEAVIYEVEVQ